MLEYRQIKESNYVKSVFYNKIDLFCGINSLGVPFSRENKEHIGYFEIVKKYLMDEGYDVTGINISNLHKNHTWDLEKF